MPVYKERQAAKKEVFRHGEVRCQVEFLVDHGDPLPPRLLNASQAEAVSGKPHLSHVWSQGSGEDFHKGGFPAPFFPTRAWTSPASTAKSTP